MQKQEENSLFQRKTRSISQEYNKNPSLFETDCGGLYWTRTSDPIDVNDVLYQLSQQTKVGFPELPFAVIRHIRIGEGAFDKSYHMVLPTEPCDLIYPYDFPEKVPVGTTN